MTKTALIVVDMQNSFLHPDGENFYPVAPEVIEPVRALIRAAEEGSAIIVHVCDRHREGFADFEQPRLPVHCISGGFNAEFFEGFGAAGPRQGNPDHETALFGVLRDRAGPVSQ
ncbi:cysteine hydrolase family protein [Hoeflea alexandrii]